MKKSILKRLPLLFFVVYAVIGLFCFDDYGCGPDEGMERQTSLVNYRYAIEKLNIPISEANTTWLAYLPDLKEYQDRYYGTALHYPLVLIESAFHFTLEPAQFYGMRHAYTFLNYFFAMVCFYRMLRRRFGEMVGLLSVALMVLTPRFFAESFYNNKDLIFVAWYVFSGYFLIRWMNLKSLKNAVYAGIVFALTCNTRFNAVVFLPMAVCIWAFDFIFRKERNKRTFVSLLLLLGVTCCVFYVVTPNFWDSPLTTLQETFEFNRAHPNHTSEGNLFFGREVDAAKTWYFVPTWICLTVPPLILILAGIGLLCFGISLITKRIDILIDRNGMADWAIFCVGFLTVLAIMSMHVTIYNTWRHCYFCYPSIIWFAAYGIDKLRKGRLKIPLMCLVGLCLIENGAWIVRYHPFEYAYFSPFARPYASLFSGDYWSISSRALLEYIVENDPERELVIDHEFTQAGSINRGLLPIEQRWLLKMVYEGTDADYYIVCRDDRPSVDVVPARYKKVFSIFVDQDEIGAVFRKK